MGIIWIVIGAAIAGALARAAMRARSANSESQLGVVSQHWLAEHRQSVMADGQP